MAQLIFNIPDDEVQRVVSALATFYGYRATDDAGNANPESREAYVKRKIADEVQREVSALATFYGYRATDDAGNANPESREAYVKRKFADEMKARVKRIERQQQAEQIVITDPGVEAG